MSDYTSSSVQESISNNEGQWMRDELRKTERKLIELVDNKKNKALEEMEMMMERMMENKEKHGEGSHRRERNYKDLPSHEKFSNSSYNNQDYQPPSRQHRSRHYHYRELKVDFPFYQKENVDECLD